MVKWSFRCHGNKIGPLLVPDKSNVYLACCRACNLSLNVESGVGVIERYEKVDKHLERLNCGNSQPTFVSSGQNFFMKRENMKVLLTSEEQVWTTVIVRALNVVENSISFNCAMRTMIYNGSCFLIRLLPKIIVRVVGK